MTRTCVGCHNDRTRSGNLSLQTFDVATRGAAPRDRREDDRQAARGADAAAGQPRVRAATRSTRSRTRSRRRPTPPPRRAESGPPHVPAPEPRRVRARRSTTCWRSTSNAGDWLPLDTKSANFDNIADVQTAVADAARRYLDAASEISRLAVGDPTATRAKSHVQGAALASQREHVDGAPFGTRGGVSVMHNFPADGEYLFRVSFYHETDRRALRHGRAALHTAEARADRGLDRRRARRAARHRSLDVTRPIRTAWTSRPSRSRHRRPAPRVGGVHPHVRRPVARPDRRRSTGRSPTRRSPTPTASRRCRTCAIWRSRGPFNADRRVRDAEPPKIFTCRPTPRRTRHAPCAREDRHAPRRAGVPAAARPSATAKR